MDIAVHKEVTYTLELSQSEMEYLNDLLITYDRELAQKFPSPPASDFVDLLQDIQEAVREGRR